MSPPEARGAGVLRLLLTGMGGVKPPGTGDVKPPTPPGASVPAEGDFHGGPGGASPPARNGEQVPRESSVVGPSSSHSDRTGSYLFARGGPLLLCLRLAISSPRSCLTIPAPTVTHTLVHHIFRVFTKISKRPREIDPFLRQNNLITSPGSGENISSVNKKNKKIKNKIK